MSVSYPSIEPTSFRAGVTIVWQKSDFANFPYADGYVTAKYTINGRAGSKTISGAWDSAAQQWTFTLSAADNDLTAGVYTLFGFVQTAGGETQPVYEGTLEVKQSLTTATQVDTRSHIRKVLDAIEAVMEKRATREQEATQLPNGVSISLLSPADLIKTWEKYKYLLAQEQDSQRVANGGSRRMIYTEFR